MLLDEQLVGEARERRRRRMSRQERAVVLTSAMAVLVTSTLIAIFLPSERSADPLLVAALVAAYAVTSRVRFEFGTCYLTPEQLVFIPTVLLLPLPMVPLVVGVSTLLAQLPDYLRRSWHPDRWVTGFADLWFCIGPVLVLAAFAPGVASIDHLAIYALALVSQLTGDLIWCTVRDRILDRMPLGRQLRAPEIWMRNYSGVIKLDSMLTPIAVMIAIISVSQPIALLAIIPLVMMLETFARDRRERYAKAIELRHAYRGTVLLLSDVVECEDPYTADHSRAVMDLAHAVADELDIADQDREELEFAAMLHDVGKIAIPKEILNKPAALTSGELDVVKTHTIEGQHMLGRVGGLLEAVGEIVRSCHERWDGTGYPDGLKGEEIPLAARIVFYCDAYNAMTTNRVYRPAMSPDAALAELSAHAGTQFDPIVAAAGARVVKRLERAEQVAAEARSRLPEKAPLTRVGAAA